MIGQSGFAFTLALALLHGSAAAQVPAVAAQDARPANMDAEAITPDEAAHKLLELCTDHALGNIDVFRMVARPEYKGFQSPIMPGMPADGSRLVASGIPSSIGVVMTTGRASVTFDKFGSCRIGAVGAPAESLRAALAALLAKSDDFKPVRRGDMLVWTRPDRDLVANISAALVRIAPLGPLKNTPGKVKYPDLPPIAAKGPPIPEVPTAAVQVIKEGTAYVLRTLIFNKPLYTYDRDEPGKSNCSGACATAWQPLWAPASARPLGQWTLLTREDGSRQWAFEGRPVYSFANDREGVASGPGVGAGWRLLPTFPAS